MSKKLKKNVPELRFPEFEKQGYKSYQLSDIASVERGKFTARPRNSPKYYGGNIPFIQTGDIKNSRGKIISYSQTLNEKGLKVSKLFPKGSILLTIAANIGDVAITEIDVACPDSIVVIQVKSNVVCEWLFYHLHTIKNIFESFATQNAQKNINLEIIRPIQVTIPSIAEQEKIANFLGAVDARLTQLRRKRDRLQTYKRGVMQKLFSQQICFKQAIGSDFPDWQRKIFQDIATKVSSKYDPAASDTNYPCIELESIAQDEGKLIKVFNSKEQQSIKNKFRDKDVLFGKLRPYLRKFLLVSFEGVCSTEIWVLRNKLVSSKYLYYLIQSDKFYQVSNVTFGSKMPRSDWDFVSCSPFAFPCKREQEKIANFLTTIDRKIEAISRQIVRTEQFKKGLLQKLFV